eukprot:TRINITY_DN25_c0_g1_i1.p2 TRINITY_DN25_c0_g1~~TRINITY_DN25_c0_g1_i1.p2  ORF type:complete len:308 (+),score=131.02 TRINITY_DN25_c0_g1_i1:62-985(+)
MEKKQQYFDRVVKLAKEYPKVLVVEADNVGSHNLQKIRKSLLGEAVVLMGKNTMIRRALRAHSAENPAIGNLIPLLKGNVGLVFTKGDLGSVRAKLLALKVAAPAKAGAVAPVNVTVPAGNTGMEPTKTSFLQALNIPSKINKGQVEIVSDVLLIKVGQKVGSSEATLLQMLNIKPFFYGLKVRSVYDHGSIYAAEILDITDDDILAHFSAGLARVASLALAIHLPTVASFPHIVINAYKNLVAVAIATEISFKQVDKLKEMIKNPAAFAVAAPAPAAAAAAPKAEAKKEEVKEEEPEEDMGFSLFD